VPDIAFYLEKIPANAPPEIRRMMTEDAKRKTERDVFGEGFQRDRNGKIIEQGRGSDSNMTAESVAAYERWCRDEPNFVETLAKKKKLLADAEARRARERGDLS
jgi:hypothetical protein